MSTTASLLFALIAVLFISFWIALAMIDAIKEPSRVAQKMGYVDWKEAFIQLSQYRKNDPNAPPGRTPSYLATSIPYEMAKQREERLRARDFPPSSWKTVMLTMPEDLLVRVKEMIDKEEQRIYADK